MFEAAPHHGEPQVWDDPHRGRGRRPHSGGAHRAESRTNFGPPLTCHFAHRVAARTIASAVGGRSRARGRAPYCRRLRGPSRTARAVPPPPPREQTDGIVVMLRRLRRAAAWVSQSRTITARQAGRAELGHHTLEQVRVALGPRGDPAPPPRARRGRTPDRPARRRRIRTATQQVALGECTLVASGGSWVVQGLERGSTSRPPCRRCRHAARAPSRRRCPHARRPAGRAVCQ